MALVLDFPTKVEQDVITCVAKSFLKLSEVRNNAKEPIAQKARDCAKI